MQKGYAVYCSTNIDFGQMEIFFVFNVYCRLMFRQYIYRSSLVSVNIDLVFSNTLTAIHSCLDFRGTLHIFFILPVCLIVNKISLKFYQVIIYFAIIFYLIAILIKVLFFPDWLDCLLQCKLS